MTLGAVAVPSVANAYIRRYHGAQCRPVNSATGSFYVENTGLLNNSSFASAFVCPFVSDSDQPHQFVTTLNVHGQKASGVGLDSVTTCVKFWGANGFFCSSDNSTSSAGAWGLSAFLNAWTTDSGANFPYVKVTLQPGSGVFGSFVVN
jgi:hypothetical protein